MDGMGGMITARQFLRERKQQEAEATRAWRLQPDDPPTGERRGGEMQMTKVDEGGGVRRMLTLEEVLKIVRVHRSTLFRMEKLGQFPQSVYISENRRMWFEDEVIAWQKALPKNSRRATRKK